MDTVHKKLFSLFGERVKRDEPLARYTTFKIGGPADIFFEAKTSQELVDAVGVAQAASVPWFILGGGTNILVGDGGIRGLVVKNSTSGIAIRGMKGERKGAQSTGTVYVEADSGVIVNKLVRFMVEEGLSGLEMHLGLPGTVGGALYMNSKWTHPTGYIGDCVYQANILTPEGKTLVVPKPYFHFAYDTSILQKTHDTVLSVVFVLKPDKPERLWQISNDSIGYRRASQPQGVFSAGCTFRNISPSQALSLGTPNFTTSAGYLVDHAGLKGVCVGDAQISDQHANFIINKGKAKASDVVELIKRVKEAVQTQFGVSLEEEIVYAGEF